MQRLDDSFKVIYQIKMSIFVAFLIHKDAGLVSDLGRHDEFMDSSIKNELKTETM